MTRFSVALCLFVLAILAGSFVCADPDAAACNATLPDGMVFDLSPMTGMDWYGNDSRVTNKTKGGFDYYVRLCGTVNNTNCTTDKKAGMVCQIDQECALCGFEIAAPGNQSSVNWTYTNGKDATGGLTGTAKRDGDACPAYNTNRGAIFHLMCGQPTVPPISSVVEVNCTYTMNMTSCQACRNVSSCTNAVEGGEEWGGIDLAKFNSILSPENKKIIQSKLYNRKGKRSASEN